MIRSLTQPMQIKTTSEQQSTVPQSILEFLKSDDLTIDMLLPYIQPYIIHKKTSQLIINQLFKLPHFQLSKWLPIIITIQSLVKSPELQNKFLNQTAFKSIPLYLLIRWGYTTSFEPESEEREIIRNKLDTKFINYLSTREFEGVDLTQLTPEQIRSMITKKEVLSNYVNILNKFYQKLFHIPDKLAQFPEQERKSQLDRNLTKLFKKFQESQDVNFCTGVCFPFVDANADQQNSSSCLIISFIQDCCFPFSTKDHIPFKIVFETLNFADYDKYKNQPLQNKQNVPFLQGFSSHRSEKSLLLPHTYFGAQWDQVKARINNKSPFSAYESYKIHAYIVKTGDDIRQEHFAMQLMNALHKIFQEEHLKLWVLPYNIIPFNRESGLIEFVHDTKTISALKAQSGEKSLRVIYKQIFGQNWQTAVTNFTHSLAGYSIYQYLFQVKDRHNNNILVDKFGHIIHIDYSFMISNSPGNLNFQKAPFKLTYDYIELMEGNQSDIFQHFKFLLFVGLKILRKYKKQIMSLINIMKEVPQMKCFSSYEAQKMQKKFHEHATDEQLTKIVQDMVQQAYKSYSTSNYDRYQWYTNTIHT